MSDSCWDAVLVRLVLPGSSGSDIDRALRNGCTVRYSDQTRAVFERFETFAHELYHEEINWPASFARRGLLFEHYEEVSTQHPPGGGTIHSFKPSREASHPKSMPLSVKMHADNSFMGPLRGDVLVVKRKSRTLVYEEIASGRLWLGNHSVSKPIRYLVRRAQLEGLLGDVAGDRGLFQGLVDAWTSEHMFLELTVR